MSDLTVQNVFQRFYTEYCDKYPVSPQQKKAAFCIMNCKTGTFGANVSVCEDCGTIRIHYNSCRNRHCPMCQALPTARWIDREQEDVLDVPYFHAVFTVPDVLIGSLIYANQKLLYNAMYHAASSTLLELAGDYKYLGAKIGVICVLHTWGSDLHYHPHIHCIVMGGGLNKNNQWVDKDGHFFFPVKVMSRLFRGKFMDELKKLHDDDLLMYYGNAQKYRNQYEFQELVNQLYKTEWVSYIKEAFNGAQSVIKYLGKYTHRIAVSNRRLISMNEDSVTLYVKDYKNNGHWKILTLSGVEFIRRFLMHVLPPGFVRIRHYGLLSTRTKNEKMTLCRNLLGAQKYISALKDLDVGEMLKALYNVDICKCDQCGGKMRIVLSRHHYLRC